MIINKSLSKVYSDIAALDTIVDGLITTVGVAGAGLTAIPDMALDSTVAKSANQLSDAVWTDVKAGYLTGAVALEGSITALDTLIDGLITTVGVAGLGLSAIPAPADMALDSTVAKASVLGEAVGASISADIAAVKASVGTPAQASVLGAAVGADISADIAAVKSVVDSISGGSSGEAAGSFSYLDAGGEQDLVELTITDRKLLQGAWLDMDAITKDGVIKCYYKVDGTNYREFSSEIFTVATDSDGVYIDLNMGVSQDFKITYTEDSDEGADRAIPYAIIWQEIE